MKILLVIILMTILIEVEGRRCHSCHKFYKHHTCPQLEHTKCEIVRRECGCCNACALNRGDKCNSKKPRCGSGLMCINEKGEALHRVPHTMKNYIGVCERVVVSPVVVENRDINERRIRI